MAPACVLLDSDVRLVARGGEKTCGGQSMSSFIKPLKRVESGGGMSFADRVMLLVKGGSGIGSERGEDYEPKNLMDWVREGMVRVFTDHFLDGPEISTLSICLPATPSEICAQMQSIHVTSADKNLLVLSTGPEFGCFASSGRYLVYNVATDSLFLAPPIDCIGFREIFGCRPVVMRRGEGISDFVLALVLMSNDSSSRQYYLSIWSPSTSEGEGQEWVYKKARIPDGIIEYAFMTDVAFAFQGQWACWVDLYFGMVTCDVLSPDACFYLKLLPETYVMNFNSLERGRPDVYSTMGCVDGKIRFLYMDGYMNKKCPRNKVTISTWTLEGHVAGLCKWVKDKYMKLCVGELWSDESFLAIPRLPKRPPMCPVLSPMEQHVVYFFLSDIDSADGHIITKGEHMLGLNLRSKKVQSWSKCPPRRSFQLFPYFVATDL